MRTTESRKPVNTKGINRLLIAYSMFWILFFIWPDVPLALAIYCFGVAACYQIAKAKGRDGILWFVAAFFTGPLAVITLALLKSKLKEKNTLEERTKTSLSSDNY